MTDPRHDAPACRRKRGLIDRVIRDRLTVEDRTHAETCPQCGPVLAKAARFDDELRRTTRRLVAEELPRGILDPALSPEGRVSAGRRAGPGFAGVAAAVVVLVLATSLAIVPGASDPTGAVPTSPADTSLQARFPTFRSTLDVIRDVRALDYLCFPGRGLAPAQSGGSGAEREGVVCKSGKENPTIYAAITPRERGEGDAKEVVEIAIEGSLEGVDSAAAMVDLAAEFARLTALAIMNPTIGPRVAGFVEVTLPTLRVLASGDDATGVIDGIQVTIQRYPDGRFFMLLGSAVG